MPLFLMPLPFDFYHKYFDFLSKSISSFKKAFLDLKRHLLKKGNDKMSFDKNRKEYTYAFERHFKNKGISKFSQKVPFFKRLKNTFFGVSGKK